KGLGDTQIIILDPLSVLLGKNVLRQRFPALLVVLAEACRYTAYVVSGLAKGVEAHGLANIGAYALKPRETETGPDIVQDDLAQPQGFGLGHARLLRLGLQLGRHGQRT